MGATARQSQLAALSPSLKPPPPEASPPPSPWEPGDLFVFCVKREPCPL